MSGLDSAASLSLSQQNAGRLRQTAARAAAAGSSIDQARTDAKLHKVARQFESVFMTEMLHLARPSDKAAHGFSTGESGGTWDVFMDQALGEAATANGGSGLAKQIEDSLRRTHAALKGSDK